MQVRLLPHPLATTQPVDGARLISGYGAVRLRGGQLDGSSAGKSRTLIRCATRVQVPAVLRLAGVMASITGFYPGRVRVRILGGAPSVAGAIGKRGSLLRKRFRVRVPGGAHAPLEERDNSPGPQPGDCGFKSRTEHGPIVYRLRSGTFTSENRIRVPVGLLRGSQVWYGAGLITQRCAGSNPVPATKILNRGRCNP